MIEVGGTSMSFADFLRQERNATAMEIEERMNFIVGYQHEKHYGSPFLLAASQHLSALIERYTYLQAILQGEREPEVF